jgi:2-keto-4-pentenoate hydratase/2-oxohepta-3-ene-1,7-dioic acid hydratase in catechol pathway
MRLFVTDIPKPVLLQKTMLLQGEKGGYLDLKEFLRTGRVPIPFPWLNENKWSIPAFLSLIGSQPPEFRSRLQQMLFGGEEDKETVVHAYDQRALVLRKPIESCSKVIIVGEREPIGNSQRITKGKMTTGFLKFASSLADPGAKICLPKSGGDFDADAVLGVIIGKRAERVSEEESLSYIAGFTLLVDVTDRKVHKEECKTKNNLLAKNFFNVSPLGPCIRIATERQVHQDMEVKLRLNGQLRQQFTLGDLVYEVAEMISYWSRLILEPGDVLGLGATIARPRPGATVESPVPIKPGDLLEVESPAIGLLKAEIA